MADGMAASLDHSEGAQLDAYGSALDVRRVVATRSRVTCTLTGVAGTGVPAGSIAKTTDGEQFRSTADAVLSPSGVTVEFESVFLGPVPAPAGTLTSIVTVIAGWETITNAAAAALGVAKQEDAAYRGAYLVRTAHRSIGPLAAMRAALEEAGGGLVRIAENNTDAAAVVQEFTLRPHSACWWSCSRAPTAT